MLLRLFDREFYEQKWCINAKNVSNNLVIVVLCNPKAIFSETITFKAILLRRFFTENFIVNKIVYKQKCRRISSSTDKSKKPNIFDSFADLWIVNFCYRFLQCNVQCTGCSIKLSIAFYR